MSSKVIAAIIMAFYVALAAGKSNDVGVHDSEKLSVADATPGGSVGCPCPAQAPEGGFDCGDKADGNYPHPVDCTRYIACVGQTQAYQMDCPTGIDGNRLRFVANSGQDPATSYCDYTASTPCNCACPA